MPYRVYEVYSFRIVRGNFLTFDIRLTNMTSPSSRNFAHSCLGNLCHVMLAHCVAKFLQFSNHFQGLWFKTGEVSTIFFCPNPYQVARLYQLDVIGAGPTNTFKCPNRLRSPRANRAYYGKKKFIRMAVSQNTPTIWPRPLLFFQFFYSSRLSHIPPSQARFNSSSFWVSNKVLSAYFNTCNQKTYKSVSKYRS